MSSRTNRHIVKFAAVTAAVMSAAVPAFASSGSGGGGTGGGGTGGGGTTSAAPIRKPVTVAATCTGGTVLSVTAQKGFNKAVEQVLIISGNTEGFWNFRLTEDSASRLLVGMGTGLNNLGSTSASITTSTGGTLSAGTWNLSFIGEKHQTVIFPADPMTSPITETCTARLTVVAG